MINAERYLAEFVVRGQKTESEQTSTFLDEIFSMISNRITELLKPIFECLGNNNSEQIRTNAPLSTTHSVHQTEGTTTGTSNSIANQPTTPSTSPLLAQAVAPVDSDDDGSFHSSDVDRYTSTIPSTIPKNILASWFPVNGENDIQTPPNVATTPANQQSLSDNQGDHEILDTSPPVSMSDADAEKKSEIVGIGVTPASQPPMAPPAPPGHWSYYYPGKSVTSLILDTSPPVSMSDADAEKKSEIVGIGVTYYYPGKSVPSSQLLDNKISLDQVNNLEEIIISLESDNEDDVDKDEWLYDDAQSDVEEPEYSLNGVSTTVNQPFSTSSNQLLNNEADFDEVDDFISQVVYGESDNKGYEANDTQSSIEEPERSLNTEEEAMRKLMLSEE